MDWPLVFVFFFVICSCNVKGTDISVAKETGELDLWTEPLTTRKLLQSDNRKSPVKDVISPAPAPRKHHHHKHPTSPALNPHKMPQAPSTLPLPKPVVQNHNFQPKHKPVNHSSPVHPSGSVKPPSAEATSKGIHVKSLPVYASVIGGVSFLLATVLVLFICIRTKKVVAVRPWATGLSGQLQKAFVKGVPALKRAEVELACEYFSNIIGAFGSKCIMYKGTLSSGVEIAVVSSLVKSSKHWSKSCESQFRKKIANLSRVNHKNFVNLLGYCEEMQPFTRMMVFEYAPNGTLFEHLHYKEAEHLNWGTRVRIAVGMAYCLDHMLQLDPPVILTNLDSSTVYLTDDFAAKVSDLNLCTDYKETKATPDRETIVYMYGIVLLELISGKIPFSDEWIQLENCGSLKNMVDPSLKSFDEDVLGALFEMAKGCVDLDPKSRPAMGEVARRLREITEMTPDGAIPKISPLWWAELEIMSPEAN
ncbi:Protein kinase family protein [Rhynchospora pubera]|uniref:Protein kinase family protein n=1 Tax=Rhynchospora pubera TaxID=906938 RepID=A0AAV8F3F1_9POAL|nr:Protein kinase family protein [Rhynchospora pubera]